MDGKLALQVTDMRLAQTEGLLRQLMREHPDDCRKALSRVVNLIDEAREIVQTLDMSRSQQITSTRAS